VFSGKSFKIDNGIDCRSDGKNFQTSGVKTLRIRLTTRTVPERTVLTAPEIKGSFENERFDPDRSGPDHNGNKELYSGLGLCTHWTDCGWTTAVGRTRTSAGGHRWPASAAAAEADTSRPPVRTPRVSAALVPCGCGGRPRAAAGCDGGAGQSPPGPSLRPNGSRLMASRSTLPTL